MVSRSEARFGVRFVAAAAALLSCILLAPPQVRAQIGESTVEPSSPPPRVRSAPAESGYDRPAPARASTPESNDSNAATASAAAPRPQPAKFFPYTIRPGDSLGSIAQIFGISPDDLAKANRMHPDDELMAGEALKVPNPFIAEIGSLRSQVETLSAQAQTAQQKSESADSQLTQLKDQVQELKDDNAADQSSLKMLPWWRATTITLGGAAIAMFAVAGVAMFEWWRMRRKFVALAEMTESLSRLDYKYKAMFAKAELRLQQLYGRRRQGITEGQPRPKLPEEMEIERLNDELKEILSLQLEKLGARLGRPRKRSRWRDMVGEADPTVEPRTVRR